MTPKRAWIAVATLILAGCGLATPRAAPDETAAAALEAAANGWIAAIAAGDADRIASFFADDAVAMYPLPAPTVGREANREVWAAFFGNREREHPITVDEIRVAPAGEMAYATGRWWTRFGPAEEIDPSGGEYLAVWEQVDGAWKIAALSATLYRSIADQAPPTDWAEGRR